MRRFIWNNQKVMKSQANSTWYVNRGLTVYRFQQFGSGLDFHKRFGSARFGSGSDFFKQFGSVSTIRNRGLNGLWFFSFFRFQILKFKQYFHF